MTVEAGEVSEAVTLDDLWSIVEGVWESLLGSAPEPTAPLSDEGPLVSSSVQMHGDSGAAVAFTCQWRTAERVARDMLGIPDDEPLTPEDVDDAIGEVVNVIGGNVKALLPGANSLTLPEVTRSEPPVTGQLVNQLDVGWPGHQARVTVWQLPFVPSETTPTAEREESA